LKFKFGILIAAILIVSFLLGIASAQDSDDDFEDDFFDDDRERFETRGEFREEFDDDDFGPEFDPEFGDYNKEDKIYYMIFELLGDEIDEFEILSYCPDAEQIADVVISKVNDKIGDVSNGCKEIEERESSCKEEIEFHCSRMMQGNVDEARDEFERFEILARSCPPNKEAMVDLCVLQSKDYMEIEFEFIEENCEFQWEDYGYREQQNCELMLRDNICDEGDYIDECLARWGVNEDDFGKDICPKVYPPICSPNEYLEEYYDDRGCKSYECVYEVVACPKVYPPICSDNEYLEEYYDDRGCMFYKCIQAEETCPKVDIVQCGYGENLELQYDGRGCIVSSYCKSFVVCGDGICNADFENENSCPNDCRTCPYTNEDAERIFNQCLENNGAPEKVYDGDCIVDVKCTIETTDESNDITGGVIGITGRQVLETFDDYVDQCRREWDYQKVFCEDQPKDCSKDAFINDCMEREKKYLERDLSRVERRCEIDSNQQLRQMERECSRMDREVDRCYEEGKRRCGQVQDVSQLCSKKLTEDNFREFVIREAKERCKFADQFIRQETYSGSMPRRVVEKILELKERGVPGEFRGILDEEADDLLDVSVSLEELGQEEEEKGIFYKMKLFLGFAREIEEGEIERLELSKERLEISINSLSKLAEQVPDEIGAILIVQVGELERQKEDIESLIEQKKKKSKGLLRLFGLFD